MKFKIKYILLLVLPILYLLFFKETFVYEDSITFANAINASQPIEQSVLIARPTLNVFNPEIGHYFRYYLAGLIILFMYIPTIVHMLYHYGKLSFKKTKWISIGSFLVYGYHMMMNYEKVGEYFYFYLHNVFFFMVFLHLIGFILFRKHDTDFTK